MTEKNNAAKIPIEVVYALPEKQLLISLSVASGTTVRAALALTDFAQQFSELDIRDCPLGIFGKQVADNRVLKAGDRIEVYRPLLKDPRELRRDRAVTGHGSAPDRNSD